MKSWGTGGGAGIMAAGEGGFLPLLVGHQGGGGGGGFLPLLVGHQVGGGGVGLLPLLVGRQGGGGGGRGRGGVLPVGALIGRVLSGGVLCED